MTEMELRRMVTDLAEHYAKSGTIYEWSAGLDKLIKVYNEHQPLARGYKYKKDGGWCMLFASVLFIETGMADLIQTEVGPWEAMNADKKAGRFRERGDYIPKPGDLVYYYYQTKDASGKVIDAWYHVAVCTNADSTVIYTTEGNVEHRVMMLAHVPTDKSIVGYCAPDFASLVKQETILPNMPAVPEAFGTYTPKAVRSRDGLRYEWRKDA